jgi:hypothetical protein
MDCRATQAGLQMLAKLESQHNQVDRTSFSMISPGTVVSFIRWAIRMTPSVFEQVDIEATKVATLLTLELAQTRAGVNITPESIFAWAYFNVGRRSIQELTPAVPQGPSGIRSVNDDKMVVSMDMETGVPRYAIKADKVERKLISAVSDIEECIITLQHILLRFTTATSSSTLSPPCRCK